MSASRVCPTCGYTHRYSNDAVADAQFPRHSCERQQQRARAARRVDRRRADRGASGPIRACTHSGHPHQHGTRVAYVKDQCRCTPCTTANTADWRAARRDQIYGAPGPYVDAAQARAHIQLLRRDGVGVEQIAKFAGTSSTHIREIAHTTSRSHTRPPITRIRSNLAQRILTIRPTDAYRSPHSQIDATGTRRRLQALVAIGWQPAALASRLGRTTTKLNETLTRDTVHARTARRVSDLYDELWNTPPTQNTNAQRQAAHEARSIATQRGWQPPLAWDDIDRDPNPHPNNVQAKLDPNDLDDIAIERAVIGDGIRLAQLTPAEQDEVVRRLTTRGKSLRDIAEQLATTERTISRRRESAARAA